MTASEPCVICRRPEVEHRDRNGHGFVAAHSLTDCWCGKAHQREDFL